MSSVRQIAREAGVSISTVSRVLNNDPAVNAKTRELVLREANRVGYTPAIGRRITTSVALAYTQEMTLSHPFDSAILEGAVRGLSESRFDLVVLSLQRDKLPGESFTQFFLRKGVRGVILRTMAESRHVCEEIAAEGFPHIVISERFESPAVNCIDADSKHDSRRAVEYLITLGHRRIAFAMHNVPDRDHLDRLDGYREALTENGLPQDEKLIFRHPFDLSGGATVMNMIISLPDRPTAVFFADPLLGVGAVKRAHELGIRIPEDVSVIGFDDTDMRFAIHPTLTAVCQSAEALGFEASRWLASSITSSEPATMRRTVPTFFEVNQSTAPPPMLSREARTAALPSRRVNT